MVPRTLGQVFQLRTRKSTVLLLVIDYLLLNTRCEVLDAIKALTFILSSTVLNAMVNDHVNAIKGMTNELDAEAGKLCVSDISMKRHLHNSPSC